MKRSWVLVLSLVHGTAHADDRPTAADVSGDPRPGAETGRLDHEPGEPTGRVVARAVLKVPRGLLEIVMAPIRGVVWVFDRYKLAERYRQLFKPNPLVAIEPALRFESNYGLTVGARLAAQVFGSSELHLYGGFGGRYRSMLSGALRVPIIDDRFALELAGAYERRPSDRFFGVGNEVLSETPPAMPVDPLGGQPAVETRYRHSQQRIALTADVQIVSALRGLATAAVADIDLGPGETGLSIEQAYDTSSLVGFPGYRQAYGELELRWDTRAASSARDPRQLVSRGTLLAAYGGRALMEDGADYWRYGIDVQRFIPLAEGPRALSLRLHGEAVSGSYAEVPFTELPALGGATYLRGFSTERFRDRVAAVATIEYQWDLARILYASVFVDAGRVYPSLDDLSFDDLRYSYGVAFEGYSTESLFARISIATSVGDAEPGVFVNLYFSPMYELRSRAVNR